MQVWKQVSRIAVLIVFILFSIPALAATLSENSNTTFNGTKSNTQWDTVENGLNLTAAGKTAQTGTYTSLIKDAGGNTSWTNFGWLPKAPYWKELPDAGGQETEFSTGNVNMAGNFGLWHFNEVNGATTFADSSGLGNTATCGSICPSMSATSMFQNAAQLNSTTRFIRTNLNNSVKNRSKVTLAMWIRTPSIMPATAGLYEEPSATSTAIPRFSLQIVANKLQFSGTSTDAASSVWVTGTTSLLVSRWYHVVAVFDADTDIQQIYLNGKLEASGTTLNITYPNLNPNIAPLIGRTANNSFNFNNGYVDEVALIGRSLSLVEVNNMYLRGANRLGFKVRSCNDNACIGETFFGPACTTATSDSYNQIVSGGNTLPLVNFPTACVPSNRYFQYQVSMVVAPNVNDTTITPVLNSVTVNFTVTESILAFVIRNEADTANLNTCDLGTASTSLVSQCVYRLKITSNSPNGYTVYVQTAGTLKSNTNNVVDAGAGPTGSNISPATVGTERYGLKVQSGNLTSGGTATLSSAFSAGTNFVRINYATPTIILQANNTNQPGATDLINTISVNHGLNISQQTIPGNYTQEVTYTVVPSF